MIRRLYSIIILPVSFIAFFLLLFSKRGRSGIFERFGLWRLPRGEYTWFHAASVGEMNGMLPIIKEWKQRNPSVKVVVTSLSSSGLRAVKNEVEFTKILPFDSPFFYSVAWGRSKIDRCLFGETELWPGMLYFLQQRRVKSHLVNGLINERSFNKYRALRWLFKSALSDVQTFSCSDEKTMNRFRALGIEPRRLRVTGNAKHDRPKVDRIDLDWHKKSLRNDQPIFLLASIHPGEERDWLRSFLPIQDRVQLIVAPRHAESYNYFASVLQESKLHFIRWSLMAKEEDSSRQRTHILLDTFGQLEPLYSKVALTFVGGTLIPEIGGHNPLEPARYGSAIVIGPHFEKIREIVSDLKAADAICVVESEEEIQAVLSSIVDQSPTILERGARAREVAVQYSGATRRIFSHIFGDVCE